MDRDNIKFEQEVARAQKQTRRDLIHSAFPSQGTEKPSYMGSQSMSPSKDTNYTDTPPQYGNMSGQGLQ